MKSDIFVNNKSHGFHWDDNLLKSVAFYFLTT